MPELEVGIFSHWTGERWSGVLDLPDADRTRQLEYLFRAFNRVTDDDNARLEGIGYRLPSLSMGDGVVIEGEVWVCRAFGWARVGEDLPI